MFNEIQAVKEAKFPPAEEKVILDSIKRNGFHAHPHNIIVAMLGKSKYDFPVTVHFNHAHKHVLIIRNAVDHF